MAASSWGLDLLILAWSLVEFTYNGADIVLFFVLYLRFRWAWNRMIVYAIASKEATVQCVGRALPIVLITKLPVVSTVPSFIGFRSNSFDSWSRSIVHSLC